MLAGQWFWIVYLVVFLFGGFWGYRTPPTERGWIWPGAVVYVLIGLLGWGVFGSPLK